MTEAEARDQYRSVPFEEAGQDLRHAVRGLRRAPLFSAAVILTLGLGIGATTVIVSVVDHVVLRPLSYPDPDRLVVVREVIDELRNVYPTVGANVGHFLEWRRRWTGVGDLAAIRPLGLTLTGDGDAERISAARASPSLFRALGARFELGRSFGDDEDQPGRGGVAVLSHGFWRRRFGADPSVIGRTVTLDGTPVVVLGVLAETFRIPRFTDLIALPATIDVYQPMALTPDQAATRGEFDWSVVARLKPGHTVASASSELGAIQRDLSTSGPDKMTFEARVTPLEVLIVGAIGRPLILLLAAVGAVLLIVCVNLANLLLARNTARTRESAVRLALGAARARLVRHALTESLLLALSGGALGIGLATVGLNALLATAPASLPRLDEVSLDGRVLAIALLVSLATGLAFGVLPAARVSRADPGETLKSRGRSVTEDRRGRDVFIGAQIALTTALLAMTGLFLASFVRVMGVDKGFVADRVLAVDLVLPTVKYRAGQTRSQFYSRLLERLGSMPGVERAAVASALPLEGEIQVDFLSIEADPKPASERPLANIRYVSPDYFVAVGTPIRRGRAIAETDRGTPVVVLSESAARALWRDEDPVGRWIVPGSNDSLALVVGIAADVRTSSLERAGSLVAYLPYWSSGPSQAAILVRTTADPAATTALTRQVLREIDPTVPVAKVRTLAEVVSAATATRRFQLALLGMFGLTALITASVGVYGVISTSLARRTGEIGIRMAFGARPGDVRRQVVREGLTPVAFGLAVGLGVSVLLSRAVRALLFEVRPADPTTLLSVAALVGVVAMVACYLPARRASTADPAAILHFD